MNPAEPQIPQHLRDTEQGKANGKDGGKFSKSNKKSQKGDEYARRIIFKMREIQEHFCMKLTVV